MAWKTLKFLFASQAPLLVHNGQLADPLNKFTKAIKAVSGKRKKTDADHEEMSRLEFLGGLYMGETGPVVPAEAIEAAIIGGAKKVKRGMDAKSAIAVTQDAVLQYDGPKDPDKMFCDEMFVFKRLVRVGQARVMRTRPIFNQWECEVTLMYEDEIINERDVVDFVERAGSQVGLCEWRPKFGRFVAKVYSPLQGRNGKVEMATA